jgi:solute carrier family 25 carnitine/acylcarnitine transporter 20/29
VRKIGSQHGIAGIYKGQVPTLAREAIGYAAYFWAYEKLMQREMAVHGIKRDEVSPAKAVLFGAAAGYAVSYSPVTPVPPYCEVTKNRVNQLWAWIYPIDMIKSRMQTDGFGPADGQKYKSTLDCIRTVWRTEGAGAFTRGLIPTLIRCVTVYLATSLMADDFLTQVSVREWSYIPWVRAREPGVGKAVMEFWRPCLGYT